MEYTVNNKLLTNVVNNHKALEEIFGEMDKAFQVISKEIDQLVASSKNLSDLAVDEISKDTQDDSDNKSKETHTISDDVFFEALHRGESKTNLKEVLLAGFISTAIDEVDVSLDYKEFARAVAIVVELQYGEHLYKAFRKELKKELGRKVTIKTT